LAPDTDFTSGLPQPSLAPGVLVLGWAVALGVPSAVSLYLRRRSAWPNVVALAWAAIEIGVSGHDHLSLYLWWALGAVGLVAWGIRDARSERINMGAAVFSATVLAFYFSEVFDKIGRSASLVGLGALFLVGGWWLERARRHFVLQIAGRIA
jgi:hypothetical protein